MSIQAFKNTNQALNFGKYNKGNKTLLFKLKRQRNILQDRVQQYINAGRLNEALMLASGQSQFIRECIEIIEEN